MCGLCFVPCLIGSCTYETVKNAGSFLHVGVNSSARYSVRGRAPWFRNSELILDRECTSYRSPQEMSSSVKSRFTGGHGLC